jgi:DNA-binding PadR family transcriptional regulator
VRVAILAVLAEGARHGYEIMRELEARSGGAWRPSAGSIYPTLQMLEDDGFVRSEDDGDGRRVYSITDGGRAELKARQRDRAAQGEDPPWERNPEDEPHHGLRDATFQLLQAAVQVARAGTSDQIAKALDIVREAKRKLYALLAEIP